MVSVFGFGNIGSGKGALLSVFPYINHLLNLKKAFVMIFFFLFIQQILPLELPFGFYETSMVVRGQPPFLIF